MSDETDPIDSSDSDSDPLGFDPFAERAFDALLSEVLGKSHAPDLTGEILDRMREPSAVRPTKSRPTPLPSKRRRAGAGFWVFVASVAASLVAFVYLRPERAVPDPANALASDSKKESVVDRTVTPVQPSVAEKEDIASVPPKMPRGIPLVLDPAPKPDEMVSQRVDRPAATDMPKQPAAIELVSRQVDSQMKSYWDAIGIEPTIPASGEETASRLKRLFGVDFTVDDIASADSIAARLTDESVARTIALRWLGEVTDGGIARLSSEDRDALVTATAESFAGRVPFDSLLTSWIGGTDGQSSSFYTAMSAGARSADDGVLSRRLASLTMNVDLRCTRCHDAYIEGNGRQEDYWSLTGMLRKELVRQDNRWSISNEPSDKPTFYDLPDGRKRVARIGVADRHIKSSVAIDSLAGWSVALAGSNELARGLVNSLWQSVHGQPLRSRVVDPMNAPYDDSLVKLESELASDLQQSGFNLGRTLALVIASPATNRSVPESLEKAWVTNDAKDHAAAEAFAAGRPRATELPLGKRLDETMRAIGAKWDASGNPLLAQFGEPGVAGRMTKSEGLSWDFPDRADSLPVQWLTPIEKTEARVDHLAYLAGLREVPEKVRQAAEAMREAGVDEPTMLTRVWWLVR